MGYPTQDQIEQVHKHLIDMQLDNFIHEDLFSPQWWFLLSLSILPWIPWWFLVDRSRIKQIWLFGALMAILVLTLDDIGSELQLWSYPYQLFNVVPRLNPIDLSVLPVLHMLIYQYFSGWRLFILVNVVTAIIYAYIFEPFFVKINIYELNSWKHSYSVPLYIMKAILIKGLLEGVLSKKSK